MSYIKKSHPINEAAFLLNYDLLILCQESNNCNFRMLLFNFMFRNSVVF